MGILLVDDCDVFRWGLVQMLVEIPEVDGLLEAGSVHTARHIVDEKHASIDLVILDHTLPDGEGLALLLEMQQQYPQLPVAMLSGDECFDLMQKSIDAGAIGFIPKSTATSVLLGAVKLMLAGGIYIPPSLYAMSHAIELKQRDLTDRQHEVMALVRQGLCNKRIASQLGISEATVKAHVTVILKSHGVSSRIQLLALQSD